MEETKKFIRSAPGRTAIVGNPFDIYGGMTISLTLKDLRSYVCVELNGLEHQEISSEIYRPGNNRSEQRNELEHAVIEELDLQYDYFKLFDVSDMPYETGFARSTAAVTAMIRAFNEAFDLGIKDNKDIAEKSWAIERKLGVCGGQERYVIAHDDEELNRIVLEERINNNLDKKRTEVEHTRPGKLLYMDFAGREDHSFDGKNYAGIIELRVPDEMKLAAAYPGRKSKENKNSFDIHGNLRKLFRNNKKARDIILDYRDKSVNITHRVAGEFRHKNPCLEKIGKQMTKSFELRYKMFNTLKEKGLFDYDVICQDTLNMKNIAEENGAYGVNQPGSKSIVFLYKNEEPIIALNNEDYHVVKIGEEND